MGSLVALLAGRVGTLTASAEWLAGICYLAGLLEQRCASQLFIEGQLMLG